jgi:citrate lyase subunit beta/citryl-CoA lyase
VPGSSERFLAKAPALEADEVFLDLEDAVAPNEKESARARVIEALQTLDFGTTTVVVRVNGTDTPHYYRDLIDVVEQAGSRLDAVMLPKVRTPGDVEMTDKLLTQIELARGLDLGRIGIEAQIEDAIGLIACEAIDGPYARVGDDEGLRERAGLARALGMDGKWTIHPGQIATVNEVFSPARAEWERAEAMLAAYEEAHAAGRGAAMHDGEMIDEANRKMAERIARAGRAAGYAT